MNPLENWPIAAYSVFAGRVAAALGLCVAVCVTIPGLTFSETWAAARVLLGACFGFASVPLLDEPRRRCCHRRPYCRPQSDRKS